MEIRFRTFGKDKFFDIGIYYEDKILIFGFGFVTIIFDFILSSKSDTIDKLFRGLD